VKYLLQNSGLVVELASYANTFLFPIALLKRLLENISPQKQGRSDLLIKTDPLNDLLASILGLEAPLVSTIGLPYGLSVFAVGIKPQ
jgi:hypothetical protein